MIMQNSFPLELAFLSDHLAFADDCDLVLLDSLESAAVQVDGMSADYGDDLPALLRQPDIMLDRSIRRSWKSLSSETAGKHHEPVPVFAHQGAHARPL